MTVAWQFHLLVGMLHDATQAWSRSWFLYPTDEAVVLVALSAFLLSAVGGFIGGAVMPYLEARRMTNGDERRTEQSESGPARVGHAS
jgi:hypothetical protein